MREKFEEKLGDEIYVIHDKERKATVAAYIKNESIHLGIAIASDKDQWCRRIGRHIAIGRAKKSSRMFGDFAQFELPPKDNKKERIKCALDYAQGTLDNVMRSMHRDI